MNAPQMSPAEFWDRCEAFDWFYEMSDDARVCRAGEAQRIALLMHAPPGSENARIWAGFVAHYYSGPIFGSPQISKPQRPINARSA